MKLHARNEEKVLEVISAYGKGSEFLTHIDTLNTQVQLRRLIINDKKETKERSKKKREGLYTSRVSPLLASLLDTA